MNKMTPKDQESSCSLIKEVIQACADCDVCRFLMDESCLFFPELYRLFDREKENSDPPTEKELHQLLDMCTLCDLCPCSNIRTEIINAKIARVREKGMHIGVRLLADVQKVCRLGSSIPKLANTAIQLPGVSSFVKRVARIAEERALPKFPKQDFFSWARSKGLTSNSAQTPKAAYFAGCTAAYLFPEVARAAVAVLEDNGIAVYVPSQQCCGMPTLVEGEENITRSRAQENLQTLLDAAESGCDLVCSCPTCGFFLKVLLKEGAFFSEAYQEAPIRSGSRELGGSDLNLGHSSHFSFQKSIYWNMLKDKPYFAGIDPLARIKVSEKVSDLGYYLERLHAQGLLNMDFGRIQERMAYFAPCHQREQNIGSPYENLLGLIPGLELKKVGGAMDCCGMGGSLGFKATFHQASTRLAEPLIRKIQTASPEALVTDCLSCRLQIRHLLPTLPVFHPLQVLEQAYKNQS